jgi:Family of unknown function (DUF5825)
MTMTGAATGPARPHGDDPLATLRFLRMLREAAGEGAEVAWQAELGVTDTRLLHHLPPPAGAAAGPPLSAWRAAYRPALCHYRRGPGFLLVSDGRNGPVVTTKLTGESAQTFLRHLDVGQAPAGDPVFDRLAGLGLILRLGDLALTLPCRLRRWPIPCTSI